MMKVLNDVIQERYAQLKLHAICPALPDSSLTSSRPPPNAAYKT